MIEIGDKVNRLYNGRDTDGPYVYYGECKECPDHPHILLSKGQYIGLFGGELTPIHPSKETGGDKEETYTVESHVRDYELERMNVEITDHIKQRMAHQITDAMYRDGCYKLRETKLEDRTEYRMQVKVRKMDEV